MTAMARTAIAVAINSRVMRTGLLLLGDAGRRHHPRPANAVSLQHPSSAMPDVPARQRRRGGPDGPPLAHSNYETLRSVRSALACAGLGGARGAVLRGEGDLHLAGALAAGGREDALGAAALGDRRGDARDAG